MADATADGIRFTGRRPGDEMTPGQWADWVALGAAPQAGCESPDDIRACVRRRFLSALRALLAPRVAEGRAAALHMRERAADKLQRLLDGAPISGTHPTFDGGRRAGLADALAAVRALDPEG